MKKINSELLITVGISAISLGVYTYDILSKRKELKKQTKVLEEIKDVLSHDCPCNCTPHNDNHDGDDDDYIFYHPV